MKRLFLLFVSLLALVFTGCNKDKKTDSVIHLRVSDIHAEGYPTVTGLYEFSRLVEERSKGRIKIEVIPGGAVGGETEALEKVQFGKLDFTRISCSPLSAFVPAFESLIVPGIYRNERHFWNVVDGDIGNFLFKELEEDGFYGLCFYDSGARSFYTTKRISSFAELQNMKIRTQQSAITMEFINKLGAIPVPMDLMESSSALQNGIIDGAENNIPSYETTGHYKYAKFYFQDEHSRVPDILVGSKKTLSTLPVSDLRLIMEAAKDSEAVQKLAWKDYELSALEKVKSSGAIISSANHEDRQKSLDEIIPYLTRRFTADQQIVLDAIKAVK